MPRKKLDLPVKTYQIKDVKNSKFNTENGTDQDRKVHPLFLYEDENGHLRAMGVNRATSGTLNLQCFQNGSCKASGVCDIHPDSVDLIGRRANNKPIYKLKNQSLEELGLDRIESIYHKCRRTCKEDCQILVHTCQPLDPNKGLQLDVRTTVTRFAQTHPTSNARQAFEYAQMKFNLLYDPDDHHLHGPGYASSKGIFMPREQSAFQRVKTKQFLQLPDDLIPNEIRLMPNQNLDNSSIKELFIRKLPSGDYLCVLNSELARLEGDLYADGTFAETTSLPGYCQLYIISHIVDFGDDRRLSYPIAFILMKNRATTDYANVFNELKSLYEQETETTLAPRSIMVDYERATINAIEQCFPNTSIKLCSVHFTRNVIKRFQKIEGNFYENVHLLYAFDMMRAITMLPMDKEHNRREFDRELDRIACQLPEHQQVAFKECRESIDKFYFGENRDTFKFKYWNFNESISSGNLATDSNPSESVNFSYNNFKRKNGKNGRMTIPAVLHNIFWFKYKVMTKKADAAKDHKSLPRRRRAVLDHEHLKQQLNFEFNQLDEDCQARSVVQYLVKFANVAKVNDRMFTFSDNDSSCSEPEDSDSNYFDPDESLTGPLMTTLDNDEIILMPL